MLIAGIRANTATDPSILLIAVHDRGDEWPAGSEVPWSEYVEMYRQMARDDADVAMIDIPTRIGPTPFSGSGLIDADNVHLTDAGNEFYASAIAGFLEP